MLQLPMVHLHVNNTFINGLNHFNGTLNVQYLSAQKGTSAMILTPELEGINRMMLKAFSS